MKYCLACSHSYVGNEWSCPKCASQPMMKDGFLSFSPELLDDSGGFNPEHFKGLVKIEENHFWFKARNRLIVWALNKFLPDSHNLLEVGCGTGFVLSGLSEALPELKLSGSELFASGLRFAADRLPDVEFWQMDARRIPFREEFDVIAACDVLEHIPQDDEVLAQMAAALKRGGGLIVTVPQHPFLWSECDEDACHVRRYRSHELRKKIESAGFRVEFQSSFVTLLFPLMVLSRLFNRKRNGNDRVQAELSVHLWQNWIFYRIMSIEKGLIRLGLRLPFGGSLLIVAKKQ